LANLGRSRANKRDLSPLVLRYYWPLEGKYDIRQGIDPDKDPIVMVLIRRLPATGKIAQGSPPSRVTVPHGIHEI
jgi:hypothetical protein